MFTRADVRNAAWCAAITLLLIVIVWPVADISFNDDWSFAFTAKRFAETGHILYNGWSSPSVIGQSYWAALWIKLFGFSFTVLRVSTAPLAAGSVAFTYALARRAGLAVSAAVFAALALALSPLFLPLATSFMTDVPGLFCMLTCSYALVRWAESPATGTGRLGWLIVGLVMAGLGGSSRQIVWVVPLAVLPYAAVVRRRDLPLVVSAAVAWVVTLGTAVAIQHWFDRQPYALPEPSLTHDLILSLQNPVGVATQFIAILKTMLLIALPAAIVLVPRVRRSRRLALTAGGVLAVIAAATALRPKTAMVPWMGNFITLWGVFGQDQLPGHAPLVLNQGVRLALAVTVYVVAAVMLASAALGLVDLRQAWARVTGYFLTPSGGRITAPALLLVAGGYLALLLTRCALDIAYDRHLLSLAPFVVIPLLMWGLHRNDGTTAPVPPVAWALMAAFGVYAVASTQEELARSRAVAAATVRLQAAGIPRQHFVGGYEFDSWTQLLSDGYINEPRIKNPPNAYNPKLDQTPALHPLYRVEYAPIPDSMNTPLGTVQYFSLLPPYHRQIWIDRIVFAWNERQKRLHPGAVATTERIDNP